MFGFFTGRRNTTYTPREQAEGSGPLFMPRLSTDSYGLPGTPEQIEQRRRRAALAASFKEDTAEARKAAWLRAQRPRLSKGSSGQWWCVSSHPGPDPVKNLPHTRIGHGATPREAYDSWINY